MKNKTKGILLITSLYIFLVFSLIFGFYLAGIGILESLLMFAGAFAATGAVYACVSKSVNLMERGD